MFTEIPHGEIYSKQKSVSHASTLQQKFSDLCRWSVAHTTISIPVCCLRWGATINGRKNRVINNLISPLIMLVRSAISESHERDAKMLRLCLDEHILFVISASVWITTGMILHQWNNVLSGKNQFVMREPVKSECFYCQQKQQRPWFIPGQVLWSH